MKFKISVSPLVVAADSVEDALAKLAGHISTVSRHIASGRDIADCKPRFSIEKVDDKAEHDELKDAAFEKHGPIDIDLDPKSGAGIARADQVKGEQAGKEAAAKAKIKDSRTDAENLAEHVRNEQAASA